MNTVLQGFMAGVGATLIMDVLITLSSKIGLTAKPSTALLGRWTVYFFKGRFSHQDIRKAPMYPFENWLGKVTHYIIGSILGILFILAINESPYSPANYFVAAIYGLFTCVFAWFWMFPSFGFGVFGKKGPPEAKLLITSTINHIFFGLGLALFFNLLSLLSG